MKTKTIKSHTIAQFHCKTCRIKRRYSLLQIELCNINLVKEIEGKHLDHNYTWRFLQDDKHKVRSPKATGRGIKEFKG